MKIGKKKKETSNVQRPTSNVQLRGLLLLLLLLLLLVPAAQAQGPNVFVTNPTTKPVPVDVVSGIEVGDVTINGGDASAAKQDTGNTSLSSIDTKLTSQATAAKQDTAATKLDTLHTDLGSVATAAKQDTAATKLDTINTTAGTLATAAGQTTTNTKLDTLHTDNAALATAAKQDTIITNTTTQIGTGTVVASTAYEASHVLKASAGTLIHCSGYNSGSAQFIMFFNSATVPANGTTPIKILPVGAQSNFSTEVQLTGLPFSTGISVSNSTTAPTKTLGSADCFFTAVVK